MGAGLLTQFSAFSFAASSDCCAAQLSFFKKFLADERDKRWHFLPLFSYGSCLCCNIHAIKN